MDLKEIHFSLQSTCPGQIVVVGCYEHSNESSGSMEGGEFVDYLSDC
jgi:hypothetical protein